MINHLHRFACTHAPSFDPENSKFEEIKEIEGSTLLIIAIFMLMLVSSLLGLFKYYIKAMRADTRWKILTISQILILALQRLSRVNRMHHLIAVLDDKRAIIRITGSSCYRTIIENMTIIAFTTVNVIYMTYQILSAQSCNFGLRPPLQIGQK